MLDSLGDSLQDTLDKLRGTHGTLSEEYIDPIVKEIQRALLESDAEVSLVQNPSDSIKNRTLSEEPPAGVTPREHVLQIVYEELVDVVGESTEILLENQTILLAGLQRAGKTTSSGKLAWWFSKKRLRSGIIQTDTFLPGPH